jgi:hypothetical protein
MRTIFFVNLIKSVLTVCIKFSVNICNFFVRLVFSTFRLITDFAVFVVASSSMTGIVASLQTAIETYVALIVGNLIYIINFYSKPTSSRSISEQNTHSALVSIFWGVASGIIQSICDLRLIISDVML